MRSRYRGRPAQLHNTTSRPSKRTSVGALLCLIGPWKPEKPYNTTHARQKETDVVALLCDQGTVENLFGFITQETHARRGVSTYSLKPIPVGAWHDPTSGILLLLPNKNFSTVFGRSKRETRLSTARTPKVRIKSDCARSGCKYSAKRHRSTAKNRILFLSLRKYRARYCLFMMWVARASLLDRR